MRSHISSSWLLIKISQSLKQGENIYNYSIALKMKKMYSEGTENVSSFYKMKILREWETISLFFSKAPL